MEKELIYLRFERENLQVFFAALAFIEKCNENRIFLFDANNISILTECAKYVSFEIEKASITSKFEDIQITIIHPLPQTEITNYYTAPLIFPRVINSMFHKEYESKINKTYFRGLLTKRRLIEIIYLFFLLMDLKALFILVKNLLRSKREFLVRSSKVHMAFTNRGRLSEFKYLDEDYYREMSNYKYVFCPKGDFIWTYRFYEAIQVGSIPLSFFSTKIYSPFFYLRKPHANTATMKEEAINNFKKFKEIYYL